MNHRSSTNSPAVVPEQAFVPEQAGSVEPPPNGAVSIVPVPTVPAQAGSAQVRVAPFVPAQAEPAQAVPAPFVPAQVRVAPFVPAQAGPAGAGGPAGSDGADWFERSGADRQASGPGWPAGAGPTRTARRMSDGDGHVLFTHVAVPTQRVPGSALRPGPGLTAPPDLRPGPVADDRPAPVAGEDPAADPRGCTERIPLRALLDGRPEQAGPVAPPAGPAGPARPGSIGRLGRGAAGAPVAERATPAAAEPVLGDHVAAERAPRDGTSTGRRRGRPGAGRARRSGPGANRTAAARSRRRLGGPVVAGAVAAAAVALLTAGFTGSLVPGGAEDVPSQSAGLAAAAPAALDPAAPATAAPTAPTALGPGAPAGARVPDPAATARRAVPGPAGQPRPATAKPAAPAAATGPRMIMIIRHGEKPGDTPGQGVNAAGHPDDHSLTPQGWNRARSLSTLFDPTSGTTRPGIARPKVIYAASPTAQGTGQRTRETVLPLAGRLGVPVNTSYGKGQEASLAKAAVMQAQKGPVLISWQHGEIPSIASGLKVVGPQPPKSWPDSRYDVVWTFTQNAQGGWTFSQTPQMLLAGDSRSTIK